MAAELLVLRSLHILAGVFWVGGGIYSTVFVMPSLAVAGPAAGPIMAELQRRKLFTVLPLAALITMLTGLRMLQIVSGGFDPAYFARPMGATYLVAAIASVIGFLLAMFISRPASVAAAQLAATIGGLEASAQAAARERLKGLQQRAAWATTGAVGLLVLATLGMAVARYL
ncbi:MAG: hypothetical protein KF709_00805 [Gemmatimonadaceae bacterium]|nr:hypothetical protein [Gemmatimonadaceae bacterium]